MGVVLTRLADLTIFNGSPVLSWAVQQSGPWLVRLSESRLVGWPEGLVIRCSRSVLIWGTWSPRSRGRSISA